MFDPFQFRKCPLYLIKQFLLVVLLVLQTGELPPKHRDDLQRDLDDVPVHLELPVSLGVSEVLVHHRLLVLAIEVANVIKRSVVLREGDHEVHHREALVEYYVSLFNEGVAKQLKRLNVQILLKQLPVGVLKDLEDVGELPILENGKRLLNHLRPLEPRRRVLAVLLLEVDNVCLFLQRHFE